MFPLLLPGLVVLSSLGLAQGINKCRRVDLANERH